MSKAIRNITKAKRKAISKYSIIIPSAGEGSRMKSFGAKPLIKIKPGYSIVDNQLNIIKNTIPNSEVILVVGNEADKVMNNTPLDIIKVENERFETTNVVRSMAIGLRAATTENVLIIYGDLIFNEATLRVPLEDKSIVFVDEYGLMSDDEVGCTVNHEDMLEHISYDIKPKWAQIIYLCGRELRMFKQMVFNRDNEKLFGYEVINDIIEKGGMFKAVSPKSMKITDVDTSKDILKVKEILE